MLSIMREYGSEVSDTAMPPRKSYVQRASVVRQFRRWNPNFTEWFVHNSGQWIPKLGIEGEKKRRQKVRLAYSEQKSKKPKTSSGASDQDDDISMKDEEDTAVELTASTTTTSTTKFVPQLQDGIAAQLSLPPLTVTQHVAESDGSCDVQSANTTGNIKIVKNVTEI